MQDDDNSREVDTRRPRAIIHIYKVCRESSHGREEADFSYEKSVKNVERSVLCATFRFRDNRGFVGCIRYALSKGFSKIDERYTLFLCSSYVISVFANIGRLFIYAVLDLSMISMMTYFSSVQINLSLARRAQNLFIKVQDFNQQSSLHHFR